MGLRYTCGCIDFQLHTQHAHNLLRASCIIVIANFLQRILAIKWNLSVFNHWVIQTEAIETEILWNRLLLYTCICTVADKTLRCKMSQWNFARHAKHRTAEREPWKWKWYVCACVHIHQGAHHHDHLPVVKSDASQIYSKRMQWTQQKHIYHNMHKCNNIRTILEHRMPSDYLLCTA